MTSLITLPNDHFAVTVPPDGCDKPAIINGVLGDNWADEEFLPFFTLPPGSYTLVALGSDISEEQAGEIVDMQAWHNSFHNPLGKNKSTIDALSSLLAVNNLEASTTLIIKRNKIV